MQAKAFAALRAELLAMFEEAVHTVSPRSVMPGRLPESAHGRTLVIAVGKAAAEMAAIAARRLARPAEGLIVTRQDHLLPEIAMPRGFEVIAAGHPVPDAGSVAAAERALGLAAELGAQDQLLVLLSGGGSAMLAAPAAGLTLDDKRAVTRDLLASGATIAEINCVRKHLSRIKGGRLAVAAGRAQVATLIISDVPGDDPSLVASGPTIADPTTLARAREIVGKYRIVAPAAVARALADPANETPSADALGLAGSEVRVLARARDALAGAAALAGSLGYEAILLGDDLEAEARHLGAGHAALARRLSAEGGPPRLLLSGGETTVSVAESGGRGGRNLEYLLGLAIALDGAMGISAIACDTDGIDGRSDAAGAIVLPDTLARARASGLDPADHLERNDSHAFFAALGDLVITGPTRTNVNDFRAILIDGGAARP